MKVSCKMRSIFISGNRRIGSNFKFVRFSLLSLFIPSDGIRLDSLCGHVTHIGGALSRGSAEAMNSLCLELLPEYKNFNKILLV